jgi:hypothetical protein
MNDAKTATSRRSVQALAGGVVYIAYYFRASADGPTRLAVCDTRRTANAVIREYKDTFTSKETEGDYWWVNREPVRCTRRRSAMSDSESVATPCSPIPAILSAVLNIGTAACFCGSARDALTDANWADADAVMWINNAISQLESARAKIEARKANVTNQTSSGAM